MPRFMLDTDTCSNIMKRSHPLVLKRLQAVAVGDVCMSVVTKAELLYGVEVSPRRTQDAAALSAFLPYIDAAFDDDAAQHYAEIRADLTRRALMIGANDLFIAAHARALGLTLVTNSAEFERVAALNLANWMVPGRPSADSRNGDYPHVVGGPEAAGARDIDAWARPPQQDPLTRTHRAPRFPVRFRLVRRTPHMPQRPGAGVLRIASTTRITEQARST